MEWSRDQDRALKAIDHWLKHEPEKQVFRLFGHAGTGKTVIAQHVGENAGGIVYYGAPTGKAASVMRRKGCVGATTCHALIYIPASRSGSYLVELQKALEDAKQGQAGAKTEDEIRHYAEEVLRLSAEVTKERSNMGRPVFRLNALSPLMEASLFVLDEGSMVGEPMGLDIESFGCKILVLGDPAQLPPVRSAGYFTEVEPDYLLTEVHRQAKESPIIRIATDIREKKVRPKLGNYGDGVRVVPRGTLDPQEVLEAVQRGGQMLVGTNGARSANNAKIRQMQDRNSWVPEPGERLVCLRNNNILGLQNGDLWDVVSVNPDTFADERFLISVSQEGSDPLEVLCHAHHFKGESEQLNWWEKKEAEEFDYGYALTVHKAQGSQWPEVLVFDQSEAFRADWWRWLYTAVTRSERNLTVIAK